MNRFFICLLFLGIFLSYNASASDIGVRAQSFSGAFRGVATANDIIFTNPAGLLKLKRLSIEGDYQLGLFDKTNRLTVSIMDSKTTSWGMALAYSPHFKASTTSHTAYLALAMPLGSDMLVLGTSLSYLYEPSQQEYRHFFNSDLALMVNVPFGLSLAFVLDHLVKPKGMEKPLGFAVGSAFDLGKIVPIAPLTLSLDWLMNDVTSNYDLRHVFAAGAELLLLSVIPLRAGYKSEDKQQYISLGSGLSLPVVAIDAVFQQNLVTLTERHLGVAVRFGI